MTAILWGRRNAYNVMKVECLLRELGLPFEHRDIGSAPGDLDTPAFRQLNPMGRIPVLAIEGTHLRESNSICRYLAERTGDAAWWPREALARARLNAWLDWELASWQPAFIDLFWGFYRCPEPDRDTASIAHAAERCRACLASLDTVLREREWLGGSAVSIADFCCSIGLHRYTHMGYPIELPAGVARWRDQLMARPAWQATAMADFSILQGRTEY